jgi:translation initiation factor IF-2
MVEKVLVLVGCKKENHHNKSMFPLSSTETKIALLEERINVYEQMMERIDTAIQKIGETSQNISQMLAVHNEKIEQCNRTDNIIVKMIEDIKVSSKEQHEAISKELSERIEKVEEKVEEISQFKWKAVGAIAIVAVLIGVIPTATSLLTPASTPATIERAK